MTHPAATYSVHIYLDDRHSRTLATRAMNDARISQSDRCYFRKGSVGEQARYIVSGITAQQCDALTARLMRDDVDCCVD